MALVSAALVLSGCLGEGNPSNSEIGQAEVQGEDATPGFIVDKLKTMAAEPAAYSDTIERHVLTQQLADTGPTALSPLIDFMAAADTSQPARLFILQCVNNYLTPAYIPNLKPLLESTDEGARAIGVTAIGHIKDPAVEEFLKLARQDVSPRVAFCALSGQAMQGDAAARQELKQMYVDNASVDKVSEEQVKREVVRVLLRDVQADDLAVLQDALNRSFIEVNARLMIAEAMGRLGDPAAVPLLEQSLGLQKEPEYGEMVKQAIAAINERAGQA
jgi:HEAT repeat protein